MHKEFSFHILKTAFFGQYWQPKNIKGVVVLLHGMGEHSGRYTHVAEKLMENDFAVIAYDNFGHGKTSGKRGHNPSFEALQLAIGEVLKKATSLYPKKPVFLYGHSMGGNLVINYVLRKEHQLKGVIASSPFLKLGFEPPKWKMTLGRLLQKTMPSVTLDNELDANHISRDQEAVQKYLKDDLVHSKISPNYSLAIIDTGKWAIEHAHKLSTQMLVLHGTNDKIIDYKGSISFVNNTPLASIELFKNGYHELHNDICKEEFLNAVCTWLHAQVK